MFVEGALQNIASAILYSGYAIALNAEARKCPTLDYGLFLGFVGVFNLILLTPCILALHLTNIEPIAVP
jgi:solute carrier family 35 protein F5